MSLSPSIDEAVVALAVPPSRRPWIAPIVEALPRLTELTLLSPIGGGGGTGGSTVFGLLLAAGLLFGIGACSDEVTAPTSPSMPAAVTAVTCTANVTAKVVSCGGPQNGPLAADEIIGGQGSRVILRSSNVLYAGTDFTFDVTVQNVGAQSLGTDGIGATGVRVFFENDPVATSGAGTITVEDDSTGTFTGSNQPYYVYTDSLPAHATSVAVPWHFSVPGTVNSFTFQVLVSSQVPAPGALLRWQPIAAISRVRYNSVAWSGGNDAMAVGEQGYSSRWNGTTWIPIPPVTGASFIKVTAVSPGVYVAVADSGKVFKFSNKLWTEVYDSPTPAGWQAVWVRDANHWFAVGNNAALLTYDNGTFTESNLGGGETLQLIAGTVNNDVTVLAAQQGGAYYVSTSGGPFIPGGRLVPDANWYLGAIAFDAGGTLIKSQISLSDYQGYIIRSGAPDDTLFTALGVYAMQLWPFHSDSLIAPIADIFANAVTVNKVRFGAAPHDSTAITPTYGNSPFDLTRLNNAGTNFAMIDNNQGIETSVGGGAWTPVVDSTVGSYAASWGRGDSVWVADTSGKLWKIVDGAATQLTGVVGATGIWGFSGAELYITAGGTVYKGDGVAPWTVETAIAGATIRSIWGDAASGTLIVPASSKRYMQRVGGVWTEPAPAADFFKQVWGCSSGQAWMVGVNGHLYDWTPTGLTDDPTYTFGSDLLAVTGTSCSDVWVGGPNSKLFHFDGVSWSPVTIGGVDQIFISSLASQSNGVVYVGGEQSKIAAVNAAGITSRMRSSDQWDDILTLWRLDNGDLFVGGQEHAILGRR